MKKALSILLLIGTFGLSSCSKSSIQDDEFSNSYKIWQQFKISNDDNYRYVVTTSSWTGARTETTITVRNGEIVARHHKAWSFERATQQFSLVSEWTEDETSINTHDPVSMTMEEVYAKAKNEWLKVDQDKNTTYFETNNDGMISSAGYVPDGCADDCFIGITITSITALAVLVN